MLRGVFEHTVDDKSRLALPARLRDELGEIVMLLPGFDGQIVVYPTPAWEEVARKVSAMNQALANVRQLMRYVYNVAECPVDRQGRISIPNTLRVHAHLDTNVVIQGLDSRLEVWNADTWQKSLGEQPSEAGKLLEEAAAVGLYL